MIRTYTSHSYDCLGLEHTVGRACTRMLLRRFGTMLKGCAMNAPKAPKTADRPSPAGVVPAVLSQFQISGKSVRLLSIDALEPRDVSESEQERITYVPDEIVNFEFEGRRYALVSDCPAQEPTAEKEEAVASSPADAHALLTNRELQICQLICMGYLTKQVAARLKLSEFTVRSYLKTVYCKLNVRSRGAMVYRFTQTFLQSTEGLRGLGSTANEPAGRWRIASFAAVDD